MAYRRPLLSLLYGIILIMITIIKTILNSHSKFSEEQLVNIENGFDRASSILENLYPNYTKTDIVFYNNPPEVNVELGVGGQTINEDLIFIPLDSQFEFSEDEIFVTVCHEFHHKMRLEAFGPMYTLLESVLAEGLAEQFEKELLPNRKLVTYESNPDGKMIKNALANLRKVMNGDEYDYNEWFFGTGKYPKWYGYTLGNYIVEEYVKHYEKMPSDLAQTPVSDFESFITTL
jgi:uncharacterized protein YjaZ